jgi:hypothetical protein
LLATAGGKVQLREQGGGIHYRGQSHQRVHFGLGSNAIVDELSILWPSGVAQEIHDIPADQVMQVIEPVASQVPGQDGPPVALRLMCGHPNPFNPRTTLRYSVPEPGWVRLTVYDGRGRMVATLVDERRQAGPGTAIWNGIDARGAAVASGVYFARLEAAGGMRTQKLVLAR